MISPVEIPIAWLCEWGSIRSLATTFKSHRFLHLTHFHFDPGQEIAVFAAYFPQFVSFWQDRVGGDAGDLSAECSWSETFRQAGQDPVRMLGQFAMYVEPERCVSSRDWTLATLDELVDDIISSHHSYVRIQLGRMVAIARFMASECREGFSDHLLAKLEQFKDLWTVHLAMDEQYFFPNCLRIENGSQSLGKRELNELTELLGAINHDHHQLEAIATEIAAIFAELEGNPVVAEALSALSQALHDFMADAAVHADKEDGILIPAVLFAHDIKRSDSESGRLKSQWC
jgi:iron-sulfur cluster repair protein YtfE (RIC family)